MNIKIGRRSLKFEIIPTIVYLCLLSLLLALGTWQLRRSDEKSAFIKLEEQRQASGTLQLSASVEDDLDALKYRHATVTGHYDQAHQFLIDNQISDGRPGYYVLTPFILPEGTKAVLVNRGWVPLNSKDRSVLPDVSVDNQQTTIAGRINSFPSVGIKLAGAEIPTDGWPSVVQWVDSAILAKKLSYPLFPFQIELDKDLPDGFKRDWRTATVMSPEQHIGYAVQWFGLALTLTLIFIWYSIKKDNE
ncbi:SURF1 family protein [Methylobacter sp. YRD-M1]|uniref:SURF1 family protein n=1 Tax=Methylobacter sp. YRD-M1 TaxID=2911520 RepID=UPI00227CE09D|nr:SURF1 family protein [Methylobacter sp. YRD-M1]WAK00911.1 SURF1 family protein [Methylobacter sp. YRD-M1]